MWAQRENPMKRVGNPFHGGCFGASSPTGNRNAETDPAGIQAVVAGRYPEGLAGLTADELAALAAGDPAGWQSAQARAVALAGGRS
jgi:hypothetical protein